MCVRVYVVTTLARNVGKFKVIYALNGYHFLMLYYIRVIYYPTLNGKFDARQLSYLHAFFARPFHIFSFDTRKFYRGFI